jgi:WD40 repeat protein
MRLAVASKIKDCILFYKFAPDRPADPWVTGQSSYAQWNVPSPTGLAMNSNGDLYAASSGSRGGPPSAVYMMAKKALPCPTRKRGVRSSNLLIDLSDGTDGYPLDIAFDGHGRMYVAWEAGIRSKIRIFDVNTLKEAPPIYQDVSEPQALCTGGDQVFAACSDGVLVIDSNLNPTLYAARRNNTNCPSAVCPQPAGICGLAWDQAHGNLYLAVGVAQNLGRQFTRVIVCSWSVDKRIMYFEYSNYNTGTSGGGHDYMDWHLAPGKVSFVATDPINPQPNELWACAPVANILSHMAPSGILRLRVSPTSAAFVIEARSWVGGDVNLPLAFLVLPDCP